MSSVTATANCSATRRNSSSRSGATRPRATRSSVRRFTRVPHRDDLTQEHDHTGDLRFKPTCHVHSTSTLETGIKYIHIVDANRKPKTENRKPKTKNRKPKTENRKPQTANRKPQTAKWRTPQCAKTSNLEGGPDGRL